MAQENKSRRTFYWLFYLMFFASLLLLWNMEPNLKPVSWKTLNEKMLQEQDVNKIEIINNDRAFVYIKTDRLNKPQYKDITNKKSAGPHYFINIGSLEVFDRKLEQAQLNVPENARPEIVFTRQTSWWKEIFSWVLPVLIMILLWSFFFRRNLSGQGSGGIFSFGKSKAVVFDKSNSSPVTFKDVAGYEEAKVEIMETVDFLKNPGNFTRLGAKIPKGILLVGPSGTGKTLMAKAVAGEAGVPFFSLSGAEFVEIFVGVGASRVRDLFDQAKQKTPCIIFIDEIDTVGRVRGKVSSYQANDERESTLNQLLSEMDGFDANTGIIVLAATNRADILDPALLRPGRFDRHIYLELPNCKEREAIFHVHLKPLTLAPEIRAEDLAKQTPGFSGADIANVCNEAALIASRSKKDSITIEDFGNAIDRVVAGLEKKTKVITPVEAGMVSLHEAGHTIVSWMLPHVDPLLKVSIIPRGKTLGSAWYLPEEHQLLTESQLFERLCVMLGGRAAEQIALNEVTTGALDDLEKATRQAYSMVAHLGMSKKMAHISLAELNEVYEGSLYKPYSEETARLIDEEVRLLIGKAYDTATVILTEHRKELYQIAQLLREKEVVYKQDLEKILGKRPVAVEKITA